MQSTIALVAWFPRGIESLEKVFNFKIVFQNLEKVLNLAKIYIRYGKIMEIINGKESRSIWAKFYWKQSTSLLIQGYVKCKIEFHD